MATSNDSSQYVGAFDLAVPDDTLAGGRSRGGAEIRQVKTAVKQSFPNVTAAVTPTHTELNYVNGVTSAIQTQFSGKQATITGGASTITTSDLTANRALVSNSSGKVTADDTTQAELRLLNGTVAGTVTASKAVTVDALKDAGTFRYVTVRGIDGDGSNHLVIDSAGNTQIQLQNNGVTRWFMETDGTLSSNTSSYENLVTSDLDMTNKKYVDDAIDDAILFTEFTGAASENVSRGLGVSSGGTGHYNVTFDSARADTNYTVIVTPMPTGQNNYNAIVDGSTKATTGFTVYTFNASGSAANCQCSVTVIPL